MPKKLDEQLLFKIEEIYLRDESETYASLAERFNVGVSTLERVGKQRGWGRKRDQQKARRADKLIKQSVAVSHSLEKLDSCDFEAFSKRRLLRIVEKGLLTFETAIDQNSENPRTLSSLATGLKHLVEMHLKLQPTSISDLVEIVIEMGVGPDEFLGYLRTEKQHSLKVINGGNQA